ncbi:MAG: HIT domain-containing protein [Bacilli bacterium]|jgi:histidine triad (HIT) family protein
MNCIFCKIIKGEIPSYTFYEDDIVKVFLDVNPNEEGHTLIIPKKHYTNIEDIPLETLTHINKISKDIYQLLKTKLKPDGLSLVQNNGSIQEVKHYHLHLIPHYLNKTKKKTIKEIYEKLKKGL